MKYHDRYGERQATPAERLEEQARKAMLRWRKEQPQAARNLAEPPPRPATKKEQRQQARRRLRAYKRSIVRAIIS